MLAFVSSCVRKFFLIRYTQKIIPSLKRAVVDQQKIFLSVLEKNKATVFGKRYFFSEINDYFTFKNRLPLQYYEQIKPDLDRVLKGEENVLSADKICFFAKSSGTTDARSKYIPITKQFLQINHFSAGKDALATYYYHYPKANLYGGKQLSLGGNLEENPYFPQKYIGDLSAIMIQNLPFWVEFSRAPNKKIALMRGDWEEKIQSIVSAVIEKDIRSLVGVPSWLLMILQEILRQKNVKNIAQIWPHFQLYLHGGVAFSPYRTQFEAICPPDFAFLECYNASEGFLGLQLDPQSEGLYLCTDHGIFYEFVVLSTLDSPHPQVFVLEEVVLGVDYALVLTNNSGLYRYLIGDTVRFISLDPYKIVITGRTKQAINVFGEELMVANAEAALEYACQMTGAWVKEYTVAPIFMDENQKGGHEWLIEFAKVPENFTIFCEMLDKKLQEVNSDYAAKRNFMLNFPKIISVSEGTFFTWMKNRGKLGGQNKVPRLCSQRNYVDELKNI